MRGIPSIVPASRSRNRHRNYMLASNRLWAGFTPVTSGGGIAPAITGENITFATGGSTGTSWIALDLTAILAVNLGRVTAVSFEVVSRVGSLTDAPLFFAGVYTKTAGNEVISSPVSGGNRYGCLFQLSAVTSPTIRIGIGANGTLEPAGSSLTVRRLCVEFVDEFCGWPYFEGVSAQSEVFREYTSQATLSGTATGLVVIDRTEKQLVPSGGYGIIIGDSFSNSQFNVSSWPDKFLFRYPRFGFFNAATSGATLASNAANIATILALPETDRIGCGFPNFAVIQGGINDVVASATFGVNLAATMAASFKTIATACRAAGIKTIIGIGVSPALGNASYNATQGDQHNIDAYNAWLEAYCRKSGYGFVDINRMLRSELNAIALDPAYDSGDALHPNEYGSSIIAKGVFDEYCEMAQS